MMETGKTQDQSQQLAGQLVMIKGQVGGYLSFVQQEGEGQNKKVRTGYSSQTLMLHVEQSNVKIDGQSSLAFRLYKTNQYLTLNPYGDSARAHVLQQIDSARVPLLPELIALVVDYIVGPATNKRNFEGEGFNYEPMTVMEGPPGIFQSFRLEGSFPLDRVGIKTTFGNYWRSEHWNSVVSQSSHRARDETWYITPISSSPRPARRLRGVSSGKVRGEASIHRRRRATGLLPTADTISTSLSLL